MRQRAGIFDVLAALEKAHVFDALEPARVQVGGEFLIAEHRQTFLERKLEPVAQGDAIAGPVVEVFVSDHRLDRDEIIVRGGVDVGQNVACVEDVEALVLHRAHGEILRGDDVEHG